jgi:DNA-binding transcriptional ArsR family regulator
MRNRYVESVDVETGEVLPGCLVYIPYRPRYPVSERFFMAFQDGLVQIAKDDDLTLEPTKVLMYLLGQLSFENFIHVSQRDIATALGMQKGNVSRAMKLLVSKGIILDGPKVGRMKTYRLSPDLGWKGRVASMEQYRRDQLRVIDGGKPDDAA